MLTVWEAHILSSSFIESAIICTLIIVFAAMIYVKIRCKHTALVRLGCCVIALSTLLVMVNGIVSTYTQWRYAQHNQCVVEGSIENFVSDQNGAESFTVNGQFFSYPTSNHLIGYDIPQRDRGSVITGEGQYVRLTYYCRSGVNIIIKIETSDSQDDRSEAVVQNGNL